MVRHPQQMVELRGRRGGGHTSAGRSARSRSAPAAHTRLATTGHAIVGRQPAGLGGHGAGEARLGQHPAQRGRQGVRVVVADDDARSATEELDGVRKGGGDDWPAARDGVDQNTGGDLIGGVIGQYDDGRGLDERSQRWRVAVAGVEGHRIRYAAASRLFRSGIAVCLAIGGQNLRVRPAGDQVPRPAGQITAANPSPRSPARCPSPGPAVPTSRGWVCSDASEEGRSGRSRRAGSW